jgi:2-dehydropantoate 2-reductase
MKIAVYGFGAIGGLIGARLAASGCAVSAVARGATLAALNTHGARLDAAGKLSSYPIRAEESPHALGPQDIVILAVKAPAMASVAAQVAPLIGPDTIMVSAMNGVPWWFFESPGVRYAGTRLQSLDPSGALAAVIPLRQIVGCVVHLSSSCPAPGVLRPGFGNGLILGEPAGGESARVAALVALLQGAGFDAASSSSIRNDIWYKLWGNMTMNPISAMTGATCDRILDDPLVNAFCLTAMEEAAAVGAAIGCPITQSGAARMAMTRKLGTFKTSMLQDAEAGKALEIDALVTSVHEIGRLTGVRTPAIDSLLGLVRLFGSTRSLYPG